MTNCGVFAILLQDLREYGLEVPTNVTISRNSMYNNAVFGIDFTPAIDLAENGNLFGVTTNDLAHADEGVNNL